MMMIFILCLITPAAPIMDDTRGTLEVIKTAYEANRERLLEYGLARFEIEQGEADSESDARLGRIRNSAIAQGTYVYAQGKARLERIYPLDVMARGIRFVATKHVISSALSVRCLTDGHQTLTDDLFLAVDPKKKQPIEPFRLRHQLEIRAGTSPFYRELEFPLRPGHPEGDLNNLAAVIDRALAGEQGTRLESLQFERDEDRNEVAVLVFRSGNDTKTYRVDLNHGAIPKRASTANASRKTETIICYDDIHSVGPDCFLPFRQTIFLENHFTRQIRILEFHFEDQPDRRFVLTYEDPVKAVDKVHSVNLAARTTYRLSDLRGVPGPGDRRFTPIRIAPADPPPELPGELEGSIPWRIWLGALGAVVLVMAAAAYVYRLLRTRRE